jgi:hypothetical protein
MALKVCDYLSLFIIDAEKQNNTATSLTYNWTIPNSYYTDQRSQVCTVEITNGSLATSTVGTGVYGFSVQYLNNGSHNQYFSKTIVKDNTLTKTSSPVIGYGHERHNGESVFSVEGNGALLTNARPQNIILKFIKHDKTEITEIDVLKGCLTLKFSYYNSIDTARELQHEKTQHM